MFFMVLQQRFPSLPAAGGGPRSAFTHGRWWGLPQGRSFTKGNQLESNIELHLQYTIFFCSLQGIFPKKYTFPLFFLCALCYNESKEP